MAIIYAHTIVDLTELPDEAFGIEYSRLYEIGTEHYSRPPLDVGDSRTDLFLLFQIAVV